MTRAAMKLANCPGVKEPSASGKIMRAIPEIWRAKVEPKEESEEETKPDIKLQDVADDVNKMLEDGGSIAGLLGHDSTFSFSPLRRTRDGKFIFQNFFKCIPRNLCFHEVRNFIKWIARC